MNLYNTFQEYSFKIYSFNIEPRKEETNVAEIQCKLILGPDGKKKLNIDSIKLKKSLSKPNNSPSPLEKA